MYGFDPDKLYRASDPAMRQIATEGVLAQWRHYGRGPAFIRMAGKIFYAGRDLIEWIESNRIEPPAAA